VAQKSSRTENWGKDPSNRVTGCRLRLLNYKDTVLKKLQAQEIQAGMA
jgi:hypothetical protein